MLESIKLALLACTQRLNGELKTSSSAYVFLSVFQKQNWSIFYLMDNVSFCSSFVSLAEHDEVMGADLSLTMTLIRLCSRVQSCSELHAFSNGVGQCMLFLLLYECCMCAISAHTCCINVPGAYYLLYFDLDGAAVHADHCQILHSILNTHGRKWHMHTQVWSVVYIHRAQSTITLNFSDIFCTTTAMCTLMFSHICSSNISWLDMQSFH